MSLLDFERITELKSLDTDGSESTLKELIHMYLASSPDRIKKMFETYYLKDFNSLKKEAHAFRSSSLALGAKSLADLCAEIESAKGGEEIDEFYHSLLKNIHTGFNDVKTELMHYL